MTTILISEKSSQYRKPLREQVVLHLLMVAETSSSGLKRRKAAGMNVSSSRASRCGARPIYYDWKLNRPQGADEKLRHFFATE